VSGHLKVHLKPNERVYINGGVIKVDRKVTIELMNEVVFLLEGHILQEDEATTPLRQLYFIVQEPGRARWPDGDQVAHGAWAHIRDVAEDQDALSARG
jgi:hypothetical protein